jgi:hypothetical protein
LRGFYYAICGCPKGRYFHINSLLIYNKIQNELKCFHIFRCWFSFRRKSKAESDLKSELDGLFENAIREKYQKLKTMG